MLSNTSKLYFPKLVFEKAATISHSTSNELKPVNLYRLDWTRKVSKCNQGQQELGPDYEQLLASLRFAISDGYIKEIRRCAWNAVAEWNTTRNIDTSVRQIYLLPATSYVEVAFRLISDSNYDEATSYYYRKDDKRIIPYLLLYKFWKNQVGNSLIFNFTKMSELLTLSMNENLSDNESAIINSFLNFIDQQLTPQGN